MVIYEGKTPYRGQDGGGRTIRAIVTGLGTPSANKKTGAMGQLWILDKELSPVEARRQGLDGSYCGSCSHRLKNWRSYFFDVIRMIKRRSFPCYVRSEQGATKTWKAHQHQGSRSLGASEINDLRRQGVRLGALGDPSMLKESVIKLLTRVASEWIPNNYTGYTQFWSLKRNQWLRRYCMASCETLEQVRRARDLGWRVFYSRQDGEALPAGFTQCPAAIEAGQRTTCQQCLLCNGVTSERDRRASISTVVHGYGRKVNPL